MAQSSSAESANRGQQSGHALSEVVVHDMTAEEIAALPLHQRNVISSRHLGRPYKIIADDLGIPLGTVRSRINRARHTILKRRGA